MSGNNIWIGEHLTNEQLCQQPANYLSLQRAGLKKLKWPRAGGQLYSQSGEDLVVITTINSKTTNAMSSGYICISLTVYITNTNPAGGISQK